MNHHTIKVTRRCAYKGPRGRCKQNTTITHPFCGKHTKLVMGLSVRPSTIKGAGRGLFAERPFRKGERICEYGGDILTVDQYDRRYKDDSMGAYGIQLDEKRVIDAAKTTAGVARYACDYHGSGRRANAEYISDDDEVWIVATRNIKVGEEIFTDYGDDMHRALGLHT